MLPLCMTAKLQTSFERQNVHHSCFGAVRCLAIKPRNRLRDTSSPFSTLHLIHHSFYGRYMQPSYLLSPESCSSYATATK